jgi:leader peptidase (prepilin peptidase)/N-methyltransferase
MPMLVLAAFALGLLFGSFLNVCISRLPHHESPVGGRSFCRSCAAQIRWYDNIPLLSWIILRARCRDCSARISWRYPAVELATGLWFALAATLPYQPFWFQFVNADPMLYLSPAILHPVICVTFALFGFLLIGLLVMDWQTQLLPNAFTFSGIFIAFVFTCIRAGLLPLDADEILLHGRSPIKAAASAHDAGHVFITGPEALLGRWLLATLAAPLLLLCIRWLYKAVRGRDGLGLGDVKLLAMISAFLGFWPAILALFLGLMFASVYAVIQVVRRRATGLTALPFGSFLAIGALIAAPFGLRLIEWYKTLL